MSSFKCCMKCTTKRCVGCHSSCPDYKQEHEIHLERKKKEWEKSTADRVCASYYAHRKSTSAPVRLFKNAKENHTGVEPI